MNKTVKYAFLDSIFTSVYIMIVAFFMTFMEKSPPDTKLFGPVAFIMLLVFSAAITGSLVFGRPILWYLDGNKKDAIKLLTYTLGIFFLLMLIVFVIILI